MITQAQANKNRVLAQRAGEKTFEGRPCKDGHTLRYVGGGNCAVCARKRANKAKGPRYAPRVAARFAGEVYYHGRICKRGHGTLRYVSSGACPKCALLDSRYHYRKDPAQSLWYGARARAKRVGRVFTIEPEHIKIPDVCPILGIELVIGHENNDHWPSVDRIDNEGGYTPGNTAVISRKANVLKNTGTAEEHKKIAAWMESHGVS